MADDLQKRLEAHAQEPVPALDPRFADQLESKLRIGHAAQSPASERRIRVALPRLIAAAAIVAAAGLGITARSHNEPSVPVAIVGDATPAPLDAAAGGSDDEQHGADRHDPADPGQAITDPSAVPTPTVQSAGPAPASTKAPVPPPAVVASPLPATTVPDPTVSKPTPTLASLAGSTPVRAVTPVPVPSTTATASPTREPAPTAEREPVRLELRCGSRVVGEVVGVVCSWMAPESDRTIASYRITRSRDGGEARVIAQQRASASLSYTDRDVNFEDKVSYLVQGLDADDRLVAASVREIVTLPAQR